MEGAPGGPHDPTNVVSAPVEGGDVLSKIRQRSAPRLGEELLGEQQAVTLFRQLSFNIKRYTNSIRRVVNVNAIKIYH